MEVRFLNVNTVPQERLAVWECWLSDDKRRRIDRLPPQQRLLSLCGDGLAREMLAECMQCMPETIAFTADERGKPLTAGMCFNVSHSGDIVACAVSENVIGLDVEQIRPVPQRLGRALTGEWSTEADFWHLWTRREAALKCCGETWNTWKHRREDIVNFLAVESPAGYAVAVCELK